MAVKKTTCPSCGAPTRASDGYYDPPSRTASARAVDRTEEALRELMEASEDWVAAMSGGSWDESLVRLRRALEAARAIL